MHAMVMGLKEAGHQVKVLAVSSDKFPVDTRKVPESFTKENAFESVPLDLKLKPWPALVSLVRNRSYHIRRFISGAFQDTLIRILREQRFDVVQFETLYMAPYLETVRKYSRAVTFLRAHNIEHLIWKRVERSTSNPLKRWYLHRLNQSLKKYELEIINQFDGVAAITEVDANSFRSMGCHVPVIGLPFGIDLAHYGHSRPVAEFPSLFFIGSMNWMPNIEGLKWFLDKVWPEIHKQHPDLIFYIAGRGTPVWLLNASIPNVKAPGEVPDAFEFMSSKAIMVVPLLSGSGIRIKIIEAMAAGRTVISTTIGAEGINHTNFENILLADEPCDFLEMISYCLFQPEKCLKIGAQARQLIEREYDNSRIIKRLEAFYHQVVGDKGGNL